MIGLGWRKKDFGWAIAVAEDGVLRRIPAGEGRETGHGDRVDTVVRRLGDHPIHAGLPRRGSRRTSRSTTTRAARRSASRCCPTGSIRRPRCAGRWSGRHATARAASTPRPSATCGRATRSRRACAAQAFKRSWSARWNGWRRRVSHVAGASRFPHGRLSFNSRGDRADTVEVSAAGKASAALDGARAPRRPRGAFEQTLRSRPRRLAGHRGERLASLCDHERGRWPQLARRKGRSSFAWRRVCPAATSSIHSEEAEIELACTSSGAVEADATRAATASSTPPDTFSHCSVSPASGTRRGFGRVTLGFGSLMLAAAVWRAARRKRSRAAI